MGVAQYFITDPHKAQKARSPLELVYYLLTSGCYLAPWRQIPERFSLILWNLPGVLSGAQTKLDPDYRASRGAVLILMGGGVLAFSKILPVKFAFVWIAIAAVWIYGVVDIPDVLLENRVYSVLPAIGILLAWLSTRELWPVLVLLVLYSLRVIERNQYYTSKPEFWRQAFRESPHKPRVLINLALYEPAARAEQLLQQAVTMDPHSSDAAYAMANLSAVWVQHYERTQDGEALVRACVLLDYADQVFPELPVIRRHRRAMLKYLTTEKHSPDTSLRLSR